MTPKRLRKLITQWRLDQYSMGMDLPEPMTAKESDAFLKKLAFPVPKKHLEYTFEFGGKFDDPYADFPDPIVPGNFNKTLNLGDFYMATAKEIVQSHKMLCSAMKAGDFDNLRPQPWDGVAECWFHKNWLPFASNGAGDHLCIDLSPAAEGKKGQVIVFAHESGLRPRLADNTREFFDKLAVTYQEELIYVTDDDKYDLRKMRAKDFPTF